MAQKSNILNDEKMQVDTAELWQTIIPAMPDYVPLEPTYDPAHPTRVYRVKNLSPSMLSRKIYLDMERSIFTYSELYGIAPVQDKSIILSLRSQMELLSISMLNVYQTLSNSADVPRLISWWIPLPKNYAEALQITYNRIFNIYLQTLTLFNSTFGTTVSTNLIIIINNLKSQLKTIQGLLNQQLTQI